MFRCIDVYMHICIYVYIYIHKYVNMVISYLPVVVTSSPDLPLQAYSLAKHLA